MANMRSWITLVLGMTLGTAFAQEVERLEPDAAAATAVEAPAPVPEVLDNRWSLVPIVGGIFSDESDLDNGLMGGLRAMRPLTDRITLDLGVDYSVLETRNAGDYERITGRIGGLLFIGKPFYDSSSDFQPYLAAGAHISKVDFIGQSTGAFGPYGGLGFMQRFSDSISGMIEARYQLDDIRDDGFLADQTYYTYQVFAGMRVALGEKPQHPDAADDDGDGVPNGLDQCPNTPAGVLVDARGCALDTDGDGVPDYLDQCPNTPAGAEVGPDGCPLDSDGDGVPDGRDKCPGTPAGVEVDADGCPATDADGDGVPDFRDLCPDSPAGVPVGEDGCPLDSDGDGIPDYLDECPNSPAGAKVLPNGCALSGDCRKPRPGEEVDANGCAVDRGFILKGVKFEFDSAILTEEAKRILDRVSETLVAYPEINVELEGHTDNIGTAAYNLGLSERRAISVKEYLAGRGIAPTRMVPVGYGLTQPIADNSTEDGREDNRRVELTVRD
ncbi:OmpA family protein [Flagellatimonas centrodinii]|uniref:OmpA family protein n=1 Tax=Flagellatimonas centrodinii TaxID=2806210 RepID=UPI00344E3482